MPSSIDELVGLIRSRATGEGRLASALPGLWLFRFDRPQPPAKKRSSTMYVGVAVQGKKRMWAGGRSFDYDRMSYLVLRGETDYEAAVVEASPERPYLALGLQLSPELVLRTLLDLAGEGVPGVATPEAPPAFVSPLDAGLVDPLCRLLRAIDDPVERRVLAPLVTRELVFRLLRTEAAGVLRQIVSRQQGDRERIRDAMAYIDANAHRKLTVEAIARRVAMSPSHFAHRFREIASVSPMRYQKHVRMERARELLLADASSGAAAIAARVGYASAAQFTRDFKRHFGLAPSRYLRAFEVGATVPSDAEAAAE